MSEHINAWLHPDDTAGGRKLARLRDAADHSGHGSSAIADYGAAARAAYQDPEKFARATEAEEASRAPAHPIAVEEPEPVEWSDEEADDEDEDAAEAVADQSKSKKGGKQ